MADHSTTRAPSLPARLKLAAATAAFFAAAAVGANASVLDYNITFMPANHSSVSGSGTLSFNTVTDVLSVQYTLNGLDPGYHMMHIHGRFAEGPDVPGGTPIGPGTNPAVYDTDHDGYVEDMNHEALNMAGDIILALSLTPGAGDFPTTGSSYHYSQTFDLSDPAVFQPPSEDTGKVYSMADLFPLTLRAIEIHGGVVPADVGAGTDGEVDGSGGYKEGLPVAMGVISGVPEPATLFLFAAGAFGLSRLRRRRPA